MSHSFLCVSMNGIIIYCCSQLIRPTLSFSSMFCEAETKNVENISLSLFLSVEWLSGNLSQEEIIIKAHVCACCCNGSKTLQISPFPQWPLHNLSCVKTSISSFLLYPALVALSQHIPHFLSTSSVLWTFIYQLQILHSLSKTQRVLCFTFIIGEMLVCESVFLLLIQNTKSQ